MTYEAYDEFTELNPSEAGTSDLDWPEFFDVDDMIDKGTENCSVFEINWFYDFCLNRIELQLFYNEVATDIA